MDRHLALRSLGTFALYIVLFKVIEYFIAFLLDDALVELLAGGGIIPRLISLVLTAVAFIIAFRVVIVGKVKHQTKIVMIYTLAPFLAISLIAVGRGIDAEGLVFRLLFLGVIYVIADRLYEHTRVVTTDHPLVIR